MEGCVFCAIGAGRAQAAIVLDEGDLIGFLDARPVFPGHTLIVPRVHATTIADLPDSVAGPLLLAGRRVAAALRTAVGSEGAFLAINDVVSQSVPHIHLHVVPRRQGDGLRGFFWPRTGYDGPGHLERIRAAIADAL